MPKYILYTASMAQPLLKGCGKPLCYICCTWNDKIGAVLLLHLLSNLMSPFDYYSRVLYNGIININNLININIDAHAQMPVH